MPNMSYCRFENTYRDLVDCSENLFEPNLSESEKKYRKRLVLKCQEIVANSLDHSVNVEEILTAEEKENILNDYA